MTLTLETLDRLIRFDTVSAHPNAGIIAYLEDFLTTRGARCTQIAPTSGGKMGLYAEIGPKGPGGILLSGHTDVVPVTGQDWKRPPFAMTREGDRLFGRGTTDMKGYLASMLTAADHASRLQLTEPLRLVFSYDEEVGCVGIQEMQDQLIPLLGAPRLCIVGEPTQMKIATGHKGKAAFRAICTGQAGHSALAPRFVNALHMAADVVQGLRAVQDQLAAEGAQDAGYDIPYSTVHVGKMSGGTALNIVPDAAEITFEIRHLLADDPEDIMFNIKSLMSDIEARYRVKFPDAAISITRINAYPGLDATPQTMTLAQDLLGIPETTKVAFGTEAGVFDRMGIPSVVCGPGTMAGQGHKADEYIEVAQLEACDQMLSRVVTTLC